jgi:Arc/MetJ-type ribon-helix-helix transcriptional regulator
VQRKHGQTGSVGVARRRPKLSATLAPENYAFLATEVNSGRAANLSEAINVALDQLRRLRARAELNAVTAAYFDALSPELSVEEKALGELIADASCFEDLER